MFQTLAILQDFHENPYSFDRGFVSIPSVSYDSGTIIPSFFSKVYLKSYRLFKTGIIVFFDFVKIFKVSIECLLKL